MQNLYRVLEVEDYASIDIIKKAYAKLLRVATMQNDEVRKNEIINAYKILGNEKTKNEHDEKLKANNSHNIQALIAQSKRVDPNSNECVEIYRRILLEMPNSVEYKNKLSTILIKRKRFSEAIEIFESFEDSMINEKIVYSIAVCYKFKGDLFNAKKKGLQAYDINKNEFKYIEFIYDIYCEKNEFDKAENFVINALKIDIGIITRLKGHFLILKLATSNNDLNKVKCNLNKIVEMYNGTEETKKKICELMGNFILTYAESIEIVTYIKEQNEEMYIDLINYNLNFAYKILVQDKTIVIGIKDIVLLWIDASIDDKNRDEIYNRSIENIYSNFQMGLVSIQNLKKNYPIFYGIKTEFLEELKADLNKKQKEKIQKANNKNRSEYKAEVNTGQASYMDNDKQENDAIRNVEEKGSFGYVGIIVGIVVILIIGYIMRTFLEDIIEFAVLVFIIWVGIQIVKHR